MKKVFFIAALVLSSHVSLASLNQYRITSQIFVDGRLVSSPNIVSMSGEKAEIKENSEDQKKTTVFGVTVSDYSDSQAEDGILIKVNLSHFNGTSTKTASTQIIVTPGIVAKIPLGKEGDVRLEIKALRL